MTRFSSSTGRSGAGGRVSCVWSSSPSQLLLLVVGLLLVLAGFAINLLSGLSTIASTSSSSPKNINNPPFTNQQRQQQESGPIRNLLPDNNDDQLSSSSSSSKIRVAYVGNSLLFFNDSPGLIAAMAQASGIELEYDSCLRGGGSLSNMETLGCSVRSTSDSTMNTGEYAAEEEDFTLEKLLNQPWDYVILHDQSRAPVQLYTRKLHLKALNDTFVEPMYRSRATPVFLQTAGYREPLKLYERMTKQLKHGYYDYANLVTKEFEQRRRTEKSSLRRRAKVAPAGEAFAVIYHTDQEFWKQLYMIDGIHPSALGTWLQACVLYMMVFGGKEPPHYQKSFWKTSTGRRRTSERLPTNTEASYLRDVAIQVTNKALGMK